MQAYQHILLAVDYSEHDNVIAIKAKEMAEQHQAKLSIIHVLDNIPMPDTSYGTVISLVHDSEYELLEIQKRNLKQAAERLNVPVERCWLVWGIPKEELPRIAAQEKVDLIVIGSHGRHGLALLLGSTANNVLHHAKCDVLAVRLDLASFSG